MKKDWCREWSLGHWTSDPGLYYRSCGTCKFSSYSGKIEDCQREKMYRSEVISNVLAAIAVGVILLAFAIVWRAFMEWF